MRITLHNQTFEVVPREGCVAQEGKWLHLTSETDDRRVNDPLSVRRVRLDGWPQPFVSGKKYRTALSFKLDANCLLADWIQLIEFHDKKVAGAGPFAVSLNRSTYDGKHYIRVWYDQKTNISKQIPFVPGHEYRVVLSFRPDHWMFVNIDGPQVAAIPADFAKGAVLYPQFGLYSNAFEGRIDGWFKFEAIA